MRWAARQPGRATGTSRGRRSRRRQHRHRHPGRQHRRRRRCDGCTRGERHCRVRHRRIDGAAAKLHARPGQRRDALGAGAPGGVDAVEVCPVLQPQEGDGEAVSRGLVAGIPGERRPEPADRGFDLTDIVRVPAELLGRVGVLRLHGHGGDALEHGALETERRARGEDQHRRVEVGGEIVGRGVAPLIGDRFRLESATRGHRASARSPRRPWRCHHGRAPS